ncbi:hypothetical protein V8B55DRAFT_1538143 [Mucor lusitanicus]
MSPLINSVAPNQEPYTLSKQQVDSYHKDGYLLIPDFFSADEHATLEAYWKWMQYYEINTNFTPFHDGMASYVNSPRLLQVIKELYGEDYNLYKEKVNYKLPGGGGFPAHQDFKAFRFGQSSHMTVIGGARLSHNDFEGRSLPQEADGSIAVDWCKQQEWVPVYCKPTSCYLTYNAAREGDFRDEYYEEKRKVFPPSYEREEGKDYSEGAIIYNLATPIRS